MSVMDSARAVLPTWVAWAATPAWMGLAFCLSWGAVWLATALPLRQLRRAGDAHWTERARLAWPARQLGGIALGILPGAFAGAAAVQYPPVLQLPRAGFVTCIVLAALAGALARARGLERQAQRRPVRLGEYLGGFAVSLLLLAPHVLLGLALLVLTPSRWEPLSVGLWGAGVLALLAACSGGTGLLLRGVGVLRPASARLLGCVAQASAATGVRARRVYEARGLPPNALAFPVFGWVAVPRRSLALLTDEELQALCAHELSHLAEPWPVTLVRIASAAGVGLSLAFTGVLGRTLGLGHATPLLVLLLLVLIPLLSRRLLRRMEERADAAGHAAEAAPATYARALERLHEANLLPAVLSATSSSVHPALYDRLLATGVEPGFPRPSPPKGALTLLGFVLLVVLAILGSAGTALFASVLASGEAADEPAIHLALAAGGMARPFAELAALREEEGQSDEAISLYRAAVELAPRCAHHPASLAHLLATRGDCDGAAGLLAEAEERNVRFAEEADDEIAWASEALATCRSSASAVP